MEPYEAYRLIAIHLAKLNEAPVVNNRERVIWLAGHALTSLFSGGVLSLFESEWPEWVKYTEIIAALYSVGAFQAGDIVGNACDFLPGIDKLTGDERRSVLWGQDDQGGVSEKVCALDHALDVRGALIILANYILETNES